MIGENYEDADDDQPRESSHDELLAGMYQSVVVSGADTFYRAVSDHHIWAHGG